MLNEAEGRVMHPEPGSRWLHHSGRVYTVLFLANDVPDPQPEYPVAVVYKGENGKLWTGRLDDWHRRMSPAPAPAEPPQGYTSWGAQIPRKRSSRPER